MIPESHIIAWSKSAPWPEQRQIEQDLIISRALVELFNDDFLSRDLRFRGGTALNKLHFPRAFRHSEDIDLVRTTAGPIRPILDRLHDLLDPWLGLAKFSQSPIAPKLRYAIESDDKSSSVPIRLKIEINTRERYAYDAVQSLLFRVENPWFTGETEIPTFSIEEILATKVRALLQRNKGRDLVDIAHALHVLNGIDTKRIVHLLECYLAATSLSISRAQAEKRMFEKLDNPDFLADIRPLLTADTNAAFDEAASRAAFTEVFNKIIRAIPGMPWALTNDMIDRFDLAGM